ncbi:uncharacterized protein LOC132238405 [Myotis daubentonii]|uniref:uncharacterized protein LOC132238405 n=1 Tax=Myotis daubentonii TaxID=98922 RepID=UPI00287315E8|nr:uncharacterized protein LOC132238405 [Myotis daubentonii]
MGVFIQQICVLLSGPGSLGRPTLRLHLPGVSPCGTPSGLAGRAVPSHDSSAVLVGRGLAAGRGQPEEVLRPLPAHCLLGPGTAAGDPPQVPWANPTAWGPSSCCPRARTNHSGLVRTTCSRDALFTGGSLGAPTPFLSFSRRRVWVTPGRPQERLNLIVAGLVCPPPHKFSGSGSPLLRAGSAPLCSETFSATACITAVPAAWATWCGQGCQTEDRSPTGNQAPWDPGVGACVGRWLWVTGMHPCEHLPEPGNSEGSSDRKASAIGSCSLHPPPPSSSRISQKERPRDVEGQPELSRRNRGRTLQGHQPQRNRGAGHSGTGRRTHENMGWHPGAQGTAGQRDLGLGQELVNFGAEGEHSGEASWGRW